MHYKLKRTLAVAVACAALASAASAQQQSYPSRAPATPPSVPTSPTYDDCGAQNAQMGSSTASAPITGSGTNGQYGLKALANPGTNALHARANVAAPASGAGSGYSIPGAGGYLANPSTSRVYQQGATQQQQLAQTSPSLGVPQSRSGQSGYAASHTLCSPGRGNAVR